VDDVLAACGVEPGRFERVSFDAGVCVFREGERADRAYLIETGVVEISKAGAAGEASTIALLKRGALFGELALISRKPRSATARAVTETACYVLDRAQLDEIVQGLDPLARLVLRQLIHSLQRLTNIYAQSV